MQPTKHIKLLSDKLKLDDVESGRLGRNLFDKIKHAHKYVLDEPLLDVASQIERTSDSNVLRALPLARLPFENVWIEFDEKIRRQYMYPTMHERMNKDGAKRLGLFVEPREGDGHKQRVSIQVITLYEDGKVEQCPFEIQMDWSAFPLKLMPSAPAPCLDLLKMVNRMSGSVFTNLVGIEIRERETGEQQSIEKIEKEAIADWLWRYKVSCSRYHERLWKNIALSMPIPTDAEKWLIGHGTNIANHARFLFCIVCLLNSKNVIAQTFVDPAMRTNIKGKKKKAKAKGDSYHVLTIQFNRAQINRAKALGIVGEASMRRHSVRGHFKRRKSGIFWWNDFERGNEKHGFLDKDYATDGKNVTPSNIDESDEIATW